MHERRWINQPPEGTRIDLSHPAARGLNALLLFEPAGAVDAAMQSWLQGGGNYGITGTRYGTAFRTGSNTTGTTLTGSPAPVGAMSLLFRALFNNFSGTTFNDSADNSGAMLYSQRATSAAVSPTLCATNTVFGGGSFGPVQNLWFGSDTVNTANGVRSDVALQTGVWYDILATYDGSGSRGGCRIWVAQSGNRLVDTTQTNNSVAGTFQDQWDQTAAYWARNPTWPSIGQDEDLAQVDIILAARWGRVLETSVAQALFDAPWQLFRAGFQFALSAADIAFNGVAGVGTALAMSASPQLAAAAVLQAGAGSCQSGGQAPTLVAGQGFSGVASATVVAATAAAPLLVAGFSAVVGPAQVQASGAAAQLSFGFAVVCGLGQAIASGPSPAIVFGWSGEAAAGLVQAAGAAPGLSTGGSFAGQCGLGALLVSGQPPQLVSAFSALAGAALVSAAGGEPTLAQGFAGSVVLGVCAVTGGAPQLSAGGSFAGQSGPATVMAFGSPPGLVIGASFAGQPAAGLSFVVGYQSQITTGVSLAASGCLVTIRTSAPLLTTETSRPGSARWFIAANDRFFATPAAEARMFRTV